MRRLTRPAGVLVVAWLLAPGAARAEDPLIRVAARFAPGAGETRVGDDLAVRPLRSGFWLHASTSPEGRIAANGLLAPLPGGGVLLVDTPWTDAQTERLLAWASASLGGVRDAIVTHAHPDRMGGLGALRRHGIRAMALDLTAAKARAEGHAAPDVVLTARDGRLVDPRGFEIFYPGPGHTVDDVVVAFPDAGIVDGGCLIKSADATGWGYVGEAFLADWPGAVRAVRDRYSRADLVVPGHGSVGGREAFVRTLEIVQAAQEADAGAGTGHVYDDVPPSPDRRARWIVYEHGAIVEREGRHAVSPDFGPYEFDAIVQALADRGFEVVAEVRHPTPGLGYVDRIVEQVHRLWRAGVPAERITLLGASRGGELALHAAARLAHPGLSVVAVSGCFPSLADLGPRLRGRVLSIRDEPDRYHPSCQPLFAAAEGLTAKREIVLHLRLDHGLLYRPRAEWLEPAVAWTRGSSRGSLTD